MLKLSQNSTCFVTSRGVVPLRHLKHIPPDSMTSLVNSLQNRVKSTTLSLTLNANTGKIVLATLWIPIEWLFYNVFGVKLSHKSNSKFIWHGERASTFTNDWTREGAHRE